MGVPNRGGPTVLAAGVEPEVDIIFLHGLRGDPINTWTKGSTCWPRDLLPANIREARIITWGYDSDVAKLTGPSSQASIFGHAENLLNDVAQLRQSSEENARPIVWVVHSLGGLVIKEALIRSAEYYRNEQDEGLGDIYCNTSSVVCHCATNGNVDVYAEVPPSKVFLGTPHRGSPKTTYGEIVSRIAKVSFKTPNNKLLEVLAHESQVLERQARSWSSISKSFRLVCFWEELPTSIGIVVPQFSATLDGFTVFDQSVHADHKGMCKFEDENDIGYKRVSYKVVSMARAAAKRRTAETKQRIEDILDSLSFPSMYDREETIKGPYAKTFEWLLAGSLQETQDPRGSGFVEWLESSSTSVYWITGKAGSGKSVLMKHLFEDNRLKDRLQEWTKGQQILFGKFYFYERGLPLQKSRLGLMRSLLHQILEQRQDLIKQVFPQLWKRRRVHIPTDQNPWQWRELKAGYQRLLELCASNSKIFLFIDGLDEYNNEKISTNRLITDNTEVEDAPVNPKREWYTEIAHLFKEAATYMHVKVCLSSRPLQVFHDSFHGHQHLRLEQLTAPDISHYVTQVLGSDKRLADLEVLGPESSHDLVQRIVEKASGVFLWVVLVVERLIDGLQDGDYMEDLERKLSSIPDKLGGPKGLYAQMLEDIPMDYRGQASRLFDLVHTAWNPLSALLLSFAEEFSSSAVIKAPLWKLSHSTCQVRSEWMEKRLKSRCSGLLEALQTPPRSLSWESNIEVDGNLESFPTVNYIHRTAKEFLERNYAWDILDPSRSASTQDFRSSQHVALLAAYVMTLKVERPDHVPESAASIRAWEAINNALYHANHAERTSGSAKETAPLLDELDRVVGLFFESETWFTKIFKEGSTQHYLRFSKPKSFLAFAVDAGLDLYVQSKLENVHELRSSPDFRSLLDRAMERPRLRSLISKLHSELREEGMEMGSTHLVRGPYGPYQASPNLIQYLLEKGASPNEPLFWETSKDKVRGTIWTRTLRAYQTDDPFADRSFSPALRHMDFNCRRWVENIKLLVRFGADVDRDVLRQSYAYSGQNLFKGPFSPLFYIASSLCYHPNAREELMLLLIDHGARFVTGEEEVLNLNWGIPLEELDRYATMTAQAPLKPFMQWADMYRPDGETEGM